MKQKFYKISFQNMDDETDEYHFFASSGLIMDMMTCPGANNRVKDAKTMEVFTIKEKVFEGLKITEQDLKDLHYIK